MTGQDAGQKFFKLYKHFKLTEYVDWSSYWAWAFTGRRLSRTSYALHAHTPHRSPVLVSPVRSLIHPVLMYHSSAMGNHHLEYGFPSTHSANSASIALYIHTLIYRLYLSGTISTTTLYWFQAALAWYTFSIVFGRLYCGMHSFADCGVGVIIGTAVWASYWATEDIIEQWLSTPGWSGKLLMHIWNTLLMTFPVVPVTLISLGE
jgi:membrane-associated phospholipid phosphatase